MFSIFFSFLLFSFCTSSHSLNTFNSVEESSLNPLKMIQYFANSGSISNRETGRNSILEFGIDKSEEKVKFEAKKGKFEAKKGKFEAKKGKFEAKNGKFESRKAIIESEEDKFESEKDKFESEKVKVGQPDPPIWPEQFHAEIVQRLNGKLAKVDLWYDWKNGRNLNLIQNQLGSTLWDIEWNNGTSFYFDRELKTCCHVTFDVGILRPDWLEGSEFLGTTTINVDFECYVWTKLDFITYYEEVKTRRPVRWDFHSRPFRMEILTFEIGKVLSDEHWQTPKFCL